MNTNTPDEKIEEGISPAKTIQFILEKHGFRGIKEGTLDQIEQYITTLRTASYERGRREDIEKLNDILILNASEPKELWYNAGVEKAINTLSPDNTKEI